MNGFECFTAIIAIAVGADVLIEWQKEKTERVKYRRGEDDDCDTKTEEG